MTSGVGNLVLVAMETVPNVGVMSAVDKNRLVVDTASKLLGLSTVSDDLEVMTLVVASIAAVST